VSSKHDIQYLFIFIKYLPTFLNSKRMFKYFKRKERMFYSETQLLFLNVLRILDRLEVGVFARVVKLDSSGTVPTSSRAEKSCFPTSTTSSAARFTFAEYYC
jgi:hypothetical protein